MIIHGYYGLCTFLWPTGLCTYELCKLAYVLSFSLPSLAPPRSNSIKQEETWREDKNNDHACTHLYNGDDNDMMLPESPRSWRTVAKNVISSLASHSLKAARAVAAGTATCRVGSGGQHTKQDIINTVLRAG